MRTIIIYYWGYLFVIGITLFSCEEVPDCKQESTYAQLKVRLFDKDLLSEERVKYDSIKALGSDSVFFSSSDSLSLYSLEVNSSVNSTVFLFYSGVNTDSLIVDYDLAYRIPFEECGPLIDVSNILVTKSTFDSTVLISDILNINLSENIEIYQ